MPFPRMIGLPFSRGTSYHNKRRIDSYMNHSLGVPTSYYTTTQRDAQKSTAGDSYLMKGSTDKTMLRPQGAGGLVRQPAGLSRTFSPYQVHCSPACLVMLVSCYQIAMEFACTGMV